jgi:hypothetical protein
LKTNDRYSSHKKPPQQKITSKEGKIRNEPMEKNQGGAITISTASSTRSRSPKHTCRCLRPIFVEATLKRKINKNPRKNRSGRRYLANRNGNNSIENQRLEKRQNREGKESFDGYRSKAIAKKLGEPTKKLQSQTCGSLGNKVANLGTETQSALHKFSFFLKKKKLKFH